MRVFVAGATGAIGRPLVEQLLAAGHEVTAMTRSAERAERLRAGGAESAVADALNAEAVREAVVAARPEVVVHQLTSIPQAVNPRTIERDFELNDRLRTEGTAHLIEGARAAGARRLVAQSIAFAYAPEGDWVKTEEAPLYLDAPKAFRRTARAVASLEEQVTAAEGLEGVALRYGFFYGPRTSFARGVGTAKAVEKRQFPIVGGGEATWSFLHVGDAASATVAALERGDGIYNVVDDEPAPVSDWLPVLAEALGAKPPRRVPSLLARLFAGEMGVVYGTKLRGAANDKAKRELGWSPRYPSWRQGFRETV